MTSLPADALKVTPISKQIKENGRFSGLFPGWGESRVIGCLTDEKYLLSIAADTDKHYKPPPSSSSPEESSPHEGLNLLASLSIGGNDLLSSSLYTSGIVASYAGKIAPLSLTLVTIMLFFYRNIYAEVVTAIPVNGGNYNAVLNVSSKKSAAVVSCLSVLSYVATAIISAFSSILYLKILWDDLDIRVGTIVILIVFAVVTLCGVGESAGVSTMIFLFHALTLTLLIIWGFAYGIQDNFEIFRENMFTDYPLITTSSGSTLGENNIGLSIFCGYCLGMLGITGAETPANYVEEMRDSKVLLGTINWMWILVGTINPLISIVSMMVMPLDFIYEHPGDLLARMADILGGNGAKVLVVVDAIVVLCGGVLAAYVGVSSLLKTLATDSILPNFLSLTNTRNAAYMAIITFCTFSILLFILVFSPHDPTNIGSFGGVFAIAFLCVLLSFIYANILLKLYRRNLGRLVIAEWWEVFFCLGCIFAALLGLPLSPPSLKSTHLSLTLQTFTGNLILAPDVFSLFVIYLSGCLIVVIMMFTRVDLYSYSIWALRYVEIDFDKMKAAKDHGKAIRKAARLREKYSLKAEFFNETDESQQLMKEEDEEDDNLPQRVTTRHTVGNVMDLFSNKEKQKNKEYITASVVTTKKQTMGGELGLGLGGISEKETELTRQSHKLNQFMAKREGKVLTDDGGMFDEEKGEKRPVDSVKNSLSDQRQGPVLRQGSGSGSGQPGKGDVVTPTPLVSEEEEEVNPNDIIPPVVYNWISSIVENLYPNISYSTQQQQELQTQREAEEAADDNTTTTRIRAGTLDKLDQMMYTSSLKFKCLEFFMESLENIVITPIVYLCKGLDPIALNLALEYVAHNELTSNIIVLHIVDDRNVITSHHQIITRLSSLGMEKSLLTRYHKKLLIEHVTGVMQDKLRTTRSSASPLERKKTALSVTDVYDIHYELETILGNLPEEIKSLPKLVSLFDTLYMSKRVSCVIVRGTVFCPASVKWISRYLNIPLTNFIMGMPGLDFPIPISKFCGVRIAVPETDAGLRFNASRRLAHVLKQTEDESITMAQVQDLREVISATTDPVSSQGYRSNTDTLVGPRLSSRL